MRAVTVLIVAIAFAAGAVGGAGTAATATGSEAYWATGAKALVPANAASGLLTNVAINAVSCPSAGNCSAVGTYVDNTGETAGLLLNETAGTWAPGVEAQLPADARIGGEQHVSINSVSCASAGNCSAVGSYYRVDRGAPVGLLLNETAGTWARGIEAALPANAREDPTVSIVSVSCPSPANCIAVGSYYTSPLGIGGLLLTETDGRWATGTEATVPANVSVVPGPAARLNAVSCAAVGNCAAVGSYGDVSGNFQGLLLTETDGVWAAGIEAALPANAIAVNQWVNPTSVSCASAGNCSAIATYNYGHGEDGAGADILLLNETGGTWATGVEAVVPMRTTVGRNWRVSAGSVSCPSTGNCAAVASDGKSGQGVLLTETSGVWAVGVKARLPANARKDMQNVRLKSVSCSSVGNCSAIGTYLPTALFLPQGLLITERAGKWATGIEATLPNTSHRADLTSISCPTDQTCSGVGTYGGTPPNHGPRQGLLLISSATPPRSCLVPQLSGKTLKTAQRLIIAHGCSVGRTRLAASSTVKAGHVISQKPAPGKRVRHATKVSLVLSKG